MQFIGEGKNVGLTFTRKSQATEEGINLIAMHCQLYGVERKLITFVFCFATMFWNGKDGTSINNSA